MFVCVCVCVFVSVLGYDSADDPSTVCHFGTLAIDLEAFRRRCGWTIVIWGPRQLQLFCPLANKQVPKSTNGHTPRLGMRPIDRERREREGGPVRKGIYSCVRGVFYNIYSKN